MKYRTKGRIMKPACTPAPITLDGKSCREKTGCTKECIPKIKCKNCGNESVSLTVLEEISTGKHIYVCSSCVEKLNEL